MLIAQVVDMQLVDSRAGAGTAMEGEYGDTAEGESDTARLRHDGSVQ
jgi:hypothetical protein